MSLARAARYPDPDADQGRHAVNLALFPHGPGLGDVVDEAERFTCRSRVAGGGGPTSCAALRSSRVTGRGVEIDAVKLADDGRGDLIVRLHEAVGNRTRSRVRCDRPDRRGQPVQPARGADAGIEVGDGIGALTVRPFEIVTLRLTALNRLRQPLHMTRSEASVAR